MQIDACLETVFPDLPVEQRIAKIARAGYRCVEIWFHDGRDPIAIRQACSQFGVTVNNLVVNAPDGARGGAPVSELDRSRYLDRLDEVITFAGEIDCRKGITCSGNLQPGLTRPQMRANLEETLGQAAAIAARRGFTLLLEPLNTMVDHAGYYLDSSHEAAEIIRAVDQPNLRLLYDIYHMQIMEGNICDTVAAHIDVIGHFHAAGVPGRGELYRGELNYPVILQRIEHAGYFGSFGLEYFPKLDDHFASLAETRNYLCARPSASA